VYVLRAQKVKDLSELRYISNIIFSRIARIKDALSVLREGGEIVDVLPVNFMNVDTTEALYRYQPPEGRYNLDVIELAPKIVDIQMVVEEIIQELNKYFSVSEEHKRQKITKTIDMLWKQLTTYLRRSFESANKILYDSDINFILEKSSSRKEKEDGLKIGKQKY
jgi:hypothetical protein